jgi:hypothetical protein
MRLSCATFVAIWVAFATFAAVAQASSQTISDPAGDTPAPDSTGSQTDVRSATVSQSGSDTTVSVSAASLTGGLYSGHVFLDTDKNGAADYDVRFSGGDKNTDVKLAPGPESTSTCQETSTAATMSTTVPTTVANKQFSFSFTFPTSAIGGAQSFLWAVYGVTPQDSPPDGYDYAPDQANPSGKGPNPEDRSCSLPKGQSGLLMNLLNGSSFKQELGPKAAVRQTPGTPSQAGGLTHLDGSGSTPSDGSRIVSYLWDFNNDGHIDANTGSNSTATFRFPEPGDHAVGLEVQDSGNHFSELHTTVIHTGSAPDGCRPFLELGWLDLSGACIHQDGRRYTIDLTSGASVDGLQIVSGPGAHLILDTTGDRWSLSADATVTVQLPDTPIGTITLFQRDLRAHPIEFGAGADHADRDAPGLLLGSFAVTHDCHPHTGFPPEVCARLPGNFPLTGSIGLYLTPPDHGGPPGIATVAHAELSSPFTVTGEVQINANADTGPQIDSFSFGAENIDIAVARVDHVRLGYTRQADNGDLDVWEGSAAATLRTPGGGGLDGSFRFANSRFSSASLTLHGVHVPVGPGIFLNSFGASLRVSPFFALGGTLGAGFGPADITGNFLFEDRTPQHVHVAGSFALLGNELASAHVDYFTNGSLQFGGRFRYFFPNPSVPVVSVDGGVDGFFEEPRFQVEGDVTVGIPAFIGRADVLVNNIWIAGCGSVQFRNPFDSAHGWGPELSGRLAFRLRDGHLEGEIGSCDLGPYRIAPTTHASAAGGTRTVRLARGLPGAQFLISSASGVPAVTLKGPHGESFTTPADIKPPIVSGQFTEGQVPNQHQLFVYVKKPSAGAWTITPQSGSPAITSVQIANQMPRPAVRAKVTGHGRTRTLVYTARRVPDQKITFREAGKDTANTLGTVTTPRGRLRFKPTDGTGRSRKILADVTIAGQPHGTLVAARYRAPKPFAPPKPGKIKARRRGEGVTLSWGAARGAGSYTVSVKGTDGRGILLTSSSRKRRVTVRAVPPSVRLTIVIRGEARRTHRAGKGRRLIVKPVRSKHKRGTKKPGH